MNASALQSFKAFFSPTDEQLMWRVQQEEDGRAFGELARRWEGPIRRLCTRLTGDPHWGEDLAQEIFARVFAARLAFRQGSKFSTYLWRVALNHTYSELRRPRHRRETLLEAPAGQETGDTPNCDDFSAPTPAPDEALSLSETGEAVRQALTELPERYRSVLVLRHYEDLKFREIAEVLGLPEGTVKTRMTEALNEMARRLRRSLDLNQSQPPHRRARPTAMAVL